MTAELYIDVRDAIVQIIKDSATLAGSNVRIGRSAPLDNPFSSEVPDADVMPLVVVSMRRCFFDNEGSAAQRARYDRVVTFQVDGYVKHSRSAAAAAGRPVDAWVDSQLDLLGSQLLDAVIFYNTFRDAGDPDPLLRLRNEAEMVPTDLVKNEFPGDAGAIVGTISLNITVRYNQDREFESIDDLALIHQEVATSQDADAKEIQIESEFP